MSDSRLQFNKALHDAEGGSSGTSSLHRKQSIQVLYQHPEEDAQVVHCANELMNMLPEVFSQKNHSLSEGTPNENEGGDDTGSDEAESGGRRPVPKKRLSYLERMKLKYAPPPPPAFVPSLVELGVARLATCLSAAKDTMHLLPDHVVDMLLRVTLENGLLTRENSTWFHRSGHARVTALLTKHYGNIFAAIAPPSQTGCRPPM